MASRVAVIGTGPSGLAQLVAFEAARRRGLVGEPLQDVVHAKAGHVSYGRVVQEG